MPRNGHPEGPAFEHYGPLQSDQAIEYAGEIVDFVRSRLDLTELPVPADILIYTEPEWQQLAGQSSRFARTLAAETIWVFSDDGRLTSRS